MNEKYGSDRAKFHKCDVTTNDLEVAYSAVIAEYKYIDVVVNCAGIMNDRPNVYLKEIAVNVVSITSYHTCINVECSVYCYECNDNYTYLPELIELSLFCLMKFMILI